MCLLISVASTCSKNKHKTAIISVTFHNVSKNAPFILQIKAAHWRAFTQLINGDNRKNLQRIIAVFEIKGRKFGDWISVYHINSHLPESCSLFPRKRGQNIHLIRLQQLKCNGQMMIFQHRLIIVHECELRAWVDQELIRYSRMINVMYCCGEYGCENFQTCKYRLTTTRKKINFQNLD